MNLGALVRLAIVDTPCGIAAYNVLRVWVKQTAGRFGRSYRGRNVVARNAPRKLSSRLCYPRHVERVDGLVHE
jgi:hypothetical protein